MSILNPVLIFLGLSLYITNAASEENRPNPTITRFTDGIFTEREYFEFISCETYGEADYFLFSCAYRALVYVLPHDAFYKINFGSSRARCYSPQMRAKYYQGNNTMLVAFQCGAWIVFCKLETNTTTTRVVQFDLANEKEIIDFLIWKEVVFVKGPQGSYFLTELKEIFASYSTTTPLVIKGRLCDMVDSVRSNSLTKKKLVTTRNKVIFFSVEDGALVVNDVSGNDILKIKATIYLMEPPVLHQYCKENLNISSNSNSNLISIFCGNEHWNRSYIFNVDPFNAVDVMGLNNLRGFLDSNVLAESINLSSELFFDVSTDCIFNSGKQTISMTWKRYYKLLDPSHVVDQQQEIFMSVDLESTISVFTILQDKANDGFAILLAQKRNMTHRHIFPERHKFPAELSGEQSLVELGDKYCLSNNHSFCLPTNCSLIDYHVDYKFLGIAREISVENCIEDYWKIACNPALRGESVDHNSTYRDTSSRKNQICLEIASETKQRNEYCLHAEFNKSCYKSSIFFISAAYEPICRPKMTDLSFSSSIKAITIESNGHLQTKCRFGLSTRPNQNILIILDELKFAEAAEASKLFGIRTNPLSKGETKKILQEYPGKTENVFTFLASRDCLEIEYSHVAKFKFRIIKIPLSIAILQQFECLSCLSLRRDCYPTGDGKCVNSQTGEFRAWLPEKGCFWMDSMSSVSSNPLSQAIVSFLSCPTIANTNFCSMNQTNQNGEISFNADDYILPICRQAFTFENASNIEIRMQIQNYEALYVVVNQKIVSSITNLTDENFTIIVHSDDSNNEKNLVVEVIFFTMDLASTTHLSPNQPKIFLKVVDPFISFSMKMIFNRLVFLLKLLIPFVVILNLCGYHICRRLSTLRGRYQLELKNVQNPYAKIEFENRHELSIQLSQKEIMELEALGITIDRTGNKVDKGDAECAVCLEKVEVRPHQLYLCGRHYVHIDCFKEWLDKSLEQGSMDLCPMRCGTIALEPGPTGSETGIDP